MDSVMLFALLVPLVLIEVGLMVWGVVDLVKRDRVRGGNKLIWAIIIVFVSIIGPVLYLAWGREV